MLEVPIRILHVVATMDRAGLETMIMNLYRFIDRSQVQFDFVVHEETGHYEPEIRALGGYIYRAPRYVGYNHFSYKKWWQNFFMDQKEYQIVHGHLDSTAGIYLGVARSFGLTTIAHSHNTASDKGIKALIKLILRPSLRRNSDYKFACSKAAGYWLFGKKINVSDKFYVIRNAIDINHFEFNESARADKRSEFGLGTAFVVGHIGRFSKQKNHNFLIDIFLEIKKLKPDARLILVGDGPLLQEVQTKVQQLKLDNDVLFTGVRDDISDLLSVMDTFLFPSLYEGLGIVAVEAQATGLSCYLSDVIPNEVKCSELVSFISLKKSAKWWAHEIVARPISSDRYGYIDLVAQNGYDVVKVGRFLEEFYIDKVKGVN